MGDEAHGVEPSVDDLPDSEMGAGRGSGMRLRDLRGAQLTAVIVVSVVVILPFLVAAVAAHGDGWVPVGDDAVLAVNAREVGTASTPALGMTTTANRYVPDVFAYHPGPLVFFYYAPFVRALGDAWGLLVAVAALGAASLWAIGYVTLRVAGPARAIGAWCVVLVGLSVIGGSAYIFQPINSVVVIAPALLFCFTSWALVSDRRSLAPLWVASGSWVLQAELQWSMLIAALSGATVLLLAAPRVRRAWAARRGSGDHAGDHTGDHAEGDPGEAQRPGLARSILPDTRAGRRTVGWTAAVGLVLWAAPLLEAVTERGGNVRQLYRVATGIEVPSIGVRAAFDLVGPTLRLDPGTTVSEVASEQGVGLLGALALLVAIALIMAGWSRVPSRDRRLLFLGGVAVVGAVLSLSAVPSDEGFQLYRVLPSVVASTFLWFGLASAIVSAHLTTHLTTRLVRVPEAAAWGAGVAVAVVAAIALALPAPVLAGEFARYTYAEVAPLADAVAGRLEGGGTWEVWGAGPRSTLYLRDGLAEALERRGVATNLRRSPALFSDRTPAEPVGQLLIMPQFADAPAEWIPLAESVPPSWDPDAADEVAARGSVPPLHLDLHVYVAQPQQRFIFVNSRKYKEGDTLAEGPLVEQITPDGAVLNFQGSRFRLAND